MPRSNEPGMPKVNRNVNGDGGGRYGTATSSIMGAPVSWGSVGADAVHSCIEAVTDVGDAVMFTRSSDGGVLVLQVFAGQAKPKWYFKDAASAEGGLAEVEKAARANPSIG